MSSVKDILVENINVDLLREQRDELLKLIGDAQGIHTGRYEAEKIDGVTNLLDYMLDVAEGFDGYPKFVKHGHYWAEADESFDVECGPCTIWTGMNENFYVVVYHNEDRMDICYRDEDDTHLDTPQLIAKYRKYLRGPKS